MVSGPSPRTVEKGVLAVLAGVPLDEAAAQVPMEPTALADAAEQYQAAGYAALEAGVGSRDWFQVHVRFPDWATAEQTAATHLAPRIRRAESAGTVASWWFIRKAPCWRLRFQPGPAADIGQWKASIARMLDSMLSESLIARWWETVYEPEKFAFGGPVGMDAAHRLFHADSRGFLDYLCRHDPGAPPERRIERRELSVLLLSLLMRGAGQEWFEQGDVWSRVAERRPLPPGTPLDRLPGMKPGLRRLMTVDTSASSTLMKNGGSLAFIADWAAAFEAAGQALGKAARDGELGRGARALLAHHVIFHWNRIGLPTRAQAILAMAAREVALGEG
ncbi:thiopeptide-type bacteriocin biosynthesis protein [Streptomyces sp. B1866]|uniref:thiopeptide-type bacteriocin biosynthesis protein n=1 Tax=Streptomyces sp. B1866 TaxID=3075431 RepID=UPI0028926D1E|nr:thiopeptide-type bacteriocin biosynthesis protein [Streptomyces sp. B1866]MDT3396322.1 thiopeptide-type bacteriocin biosynthesis protein [Streptomyces sp. B1866]